MMVTIAGLESLSVSDVVPFLQGPPWLRPRSLELPITLLYFIICANHANLVEGTKVELFLNQFWAYLTTTKVKLT